MPGWTRFKERLSHTTSSNQSDPSQKTQFREKGSALPVAQPPKPLLPTVHLEPFPTFLNLEPDSPVVTARVELHTAYESLEAVLQQITSSPSSAFLPDLGKELNDATGDNRIEVVVANILSHHDVHDSSHSRRIGDFLAKLYPVTKLALDLASSASSVASFAPLEVTANGLSQILTLAMDPRNQSKEIEDALGGLGRNQQFVRGLQQLSATSLDQSTVTSGIEYLCAVMNFLRVSLLYLKKDYFIKFMNGIVGIQDVTDVIRVLNGARTSMDTAVDRVVNLAILRREEATVRQLTLLEISRLDSNTVHRGICERRLSMTGQWLLQEDSFLTWRNSTYTSQILWCSGLPGVGKTFISSVIIDHLIAKYQEKNVGVVFFYSNYRRQNEQTALSVVLALSKQLVEQKLGLLDTAKRFAKDSRSRSLVTAASTTLENGVAFFKKTIEPFEKVFVVFDALDEYSNDLDERVAMVDLLRSLLVSVGSAKMSLCITSRDQPVVWAMLQKAALQKTDLGMQACDAQQIKILPIAEDITRLVNDRIDKSIRVKEWCEEVVTLRDDIIDTILQKSDRIFMLANLQTARVLRQTSLGLLQRTLRGLTITHDMKEYYVEAMARIRSKTGEERDAVIKLLTILLYTEQPLDVLAVEHAMAAEEEISTLEDIKRYSVSAELIGSWSEGLIVISGQDSVGLAHETVQSFFTSEPQYLWSGHEYMLRLCIATLSIGDCFRSLMAGTMTQAPFEIRSVLYSAFQPRSKRDVASTNNKKALAVGFRFSWYASRYWGHHLEMLDDDALPAYVGAFLDRLYSSSSGKLQAWQWCSDKGWIRACQALIQRGADVNKLHPLLGWSALHRASDFGLEPMVKFLVAQPGIRIGLQDKAGRTALTYASLNGFTSILELLLQCDIGDTINTKDTNWGWTPLSLAAANGHLDCVRLLLTQKSIDIDTVDNEGRTALIHAARRGRANVVQALLSFGLTRPDITLRDAEGRTALSHAAAASNPTGWRASSLQYEHVVKMLLLCEGVDVHQEDNEGHSPLWWARSGESAHHKSIVKMLEDFESTTAGA